MDRRWHHDHAAVTTYVDTRNDRHAVAELPISSGKIEMPAATTGLAFQGHRKAPEALLPALETLLATMAHIDVQGEEARVLGRVEDLIASGVGRLLVATHSRRLHRSVRCTLNRLGWEVVYDYGFRSRRRTDLGDVYFVDGLLAYRNPRFSR